MCYSCFFDSAILHWPDFIAVFFLLANFCNLHHLG
jgi:hypothetical protein